MMLFLEIISLCLAACLCFVCTKSDLQEGLIYNKILLSFSFAAAIIDAIYYGIFARDIFLDFILNFLVVAFISLYLFFSHSFAGGDCKIVFAFSGQVLCCVWNKQYNTGVCYWICDFCRIYLLAG